jgi:hypothetical protein
MKTQVMSVLGWDTLRLYVASAAMIIDARGLWSNAVWGTRISTDLSGRRYLSPSTTLSLRTQAFELLQNVLADATASELTRTLEASGETALLDLVQLAARKGDTTELRVPAMYVLSNLALGNEKVRTALVGRVEILEAISEGLVSELRNDICLHTPTRLDRIGDPGCLSSISAGSASAPSATDCSRRHYRDKHEMGEQSVPALTPFAERQARLAQTPFSPNPPPSPRIQLPLPPAETNDSRPISAVSVETPSPGAERGEHEFGCVSGGGDGSGPVGAGEGRGECGRCGDQMKRRARECMTRPGQRVSSVEL